MLLISKFNFVSWRLYYFGLNTCHLSLYLRLLCFLFSLFSTFHWVRLSSCFEAKIFQYLYCLKIVLIIFSFKATVEFTKIFDHPFLIWNLLCVFLFLFFFVNLWQTSWSLICVIQFLSCFHIWITVWSWSCKFRVLKISFNIIIHFLFVHSFFWSLVLVWFLFLLG